MKCIVNTLRNTDPQSTATSNQRDHFRAKPQDNPKRTDAPLCSSRPSRAPGSKRGALGIRQCRCLSEASFDIDPQSEHCRCLPKARGSGRLLHSGAAVRVLPKQRCTLEKHKCTRQKTNPQDLSKACKKLRLHQCTSCSLIRVSSC
jgi:hypothetical protein